MRGILILSVLVVLLSYGLYEPLPEGWKQPWKTRVLLSGLRLVNHAAGFLSLFGVNKINFTRSALDISGAVIHSRSHLHSLVNTHDTVIDGIAVRVYVPKGKDTKGRNSPGMVYYHGGGWTIGSVNTHDLVVKRLVHDLQVIAISVEYRLSPEHKFPTPYDDCVSATKYFLNNARDFGVDRNRIALAGDSAGGNLATSISMKLRDEKFPIRPKLQVLFYPALQLLNLQTPSFQANKDGPFLTSEAAGFYYANYIQGHQDNVTAWLTNQHVPHYIMDFMKSSYMKLDLLPADDIVKNYKTVKSPEKTILWDELRDVILNPYVSPLFADDLSGMPRAYINACQNDVLRDDAIWYAHRLIDAEVDVKFDLLHCFHAWNSFTEDLESANSAMEKLVSYVKTVL